MLLHLIPVQGDYIITIDRTNWRFGVFDINILMAAVAYTGTTHPPGLDIVAQKRGLQHRGADLPAQTCTGGSAPEPDQGHRRGP